MKKVIGFLPVFLLALLLVFGGDRTCASSVNDPMVQLKESVDKILAILQADELQMPGRENERRNLILDVVNRMFDFREMARSSLGKNWNDLTDEERDTFVGLFTSLIEQRYIGKIDAYNDQKVIYKDTRVKNDRAKVYTAIIDKDLEIPIDYSLHRPGKKWLVKDLRIENVSLVANYRRDFNSIIRKDKFAGLIEKITEQLEKSERKN